MKVVINVDYGGFGLSQQAIRRLVDLGAPVADGDPNKGCLAQAIYRTPDGSYYDEWAVHNRSHSLLVQVVEELGAAANGEFAELKIVEVPDDVQWEIEEYDGNELVAEAHRTWS